MSSTESIYLVARVLTCGIWIAAGFYKATHFVDTTKEMASHGIPAVSYVLVLVIALELLGSVGLIIDSYVWFICLAWLIFMVPASYLYHFRFMLRDGTIDFLQWVMFWKNVSIAGGLIALILLDQNRPDWLFAS
jgi:putative oxidoreductase